MTDNAGWDAAANVIDLISATATATAIAIATGSPFDESTDIEQDFSAMKGSHGGPHDGPSQDNGECRLLGPFALLVQGGLGVLALSVLLIKRWRERPQRPLKIWAFDVSKQVVGSVLVHVANLMMSMLSSGQFNMAIKAQELVGATDGGVVKRGFSLMVRMAEENGSYQPNPCSFYLLNLAIDTTIGIPILILLLRVFAGLLSLTPLGNPPESLKSGVYSPPGESPRYGWWVKQCLVYFLGLLGMKFVVLLIFLILPWISRIGDWALRWTEGNEDLQVFFVMLFFPLIMNATQYYIIDSFIKNPEGAHEVSQDEESSFAGDDDDDDDIFGSDISDSEADVEEQALKGRHQVPIEVKTKPLKRSSTDIHAYDEDYDGDSSPTVVGSGSSLVHRDISKVPKKID